MTRIQALLLSVFELYQTQNYSFSQFEAQKLAYFLQVTGKPLGFNYKKNRLGPYAYNLNYLLQLMEGYYIRGYGDGYERAEIRVLPEASRAVLAFLINDAEAQAHLQLVQQIIYGFETPYGLELLAMVHWTMQENREIATNVEKIIAIVQSWNSHKKERYQPFHVQQAWQHLKNQPMLNYNP